MQHVDDMTQTGAQARLYPIGEVAKLTGVPIKTIRYYADIGLLPPAQKTEARYRLFSAGDIWRLELIRTLRSFGFALDDIHRLLAGDLSIPQAIDVQLAAIDQQIEYLTRVQRVLTQAKATAHTADDSLRYLHELGTALHGDVQKRRDLLNRKLRAMLNTDGLLPSQEQLLHGIAQQLPAQMSAEQTTAWSELVALVNDPAYGAALHRQFALAPAGASSGDEQQAWQARMNGIMQRAPAAWESGADATSAAIQTLVDEWIDLFATLVQRPNTPDFVQWLAANPYTIVPEEVERFWTLLARLQNQPPSNHFAALRLIMQGIELRAAQRT